MLRSCRMHRGRRFVQFVLAHPWLPTQSAIVTGANTGTCDVSWLLANVHSETRGLIVETYVPTAKSSGSKTIKFALAPELAKTAKSASVVNSGLDLIITTPRNCRCGQLAESTLQE